MVTNCLDCWRSLKDHNMKKLSLINQSNYQRRKQKMNKKLKDMNASLQAIANDNSIDFDQHHHLIPKVNSLRDEAESFKYFLSAQFVEIALKHEYDMKLIEQELVSSTTTPNTIVNVVNANHNALSEATTKVASVSRKLDGVNNKKDNTGGIGEARG